MSISSGKLKSMITKLFNERLKWAGLWFEHAFKKNDITLDNGWLGRANKNTTDRVEPLPKGTPFNIYDGVISTNSVVTKQMIYGQRYNFGITGFINGYRVYTITGNTYTIYTVNDPNGSSEISQLITIQANSTGWQDLTIIPRILPSNTEFDLLVVVAEPSPTPTETTLSYDYLTPTNAALPANGQIIHPDKLTGVMSVSKFDQSGDQSVFLATLDVGDVITGAGLSWAIQTISDEGSYYNFAVAPTQQGSPGGVQDFIFETVMATPITYAEDLDYWLGSAIVNGLYTATGGIGDLVVDNSQYGVDLLVQEADISEDFDILAFSDVGRGQGGSDISSIQLANTAIIIESLAPSQTNARFNSSPVTKISQTRNIVGTYMVTFSFEPSCSSTNRSVNVGLYIDDTLIDSVFAMEMKDTRNQPYPSKSFPFTFDGFHDIRVDFGKENGGGGSSVTLQNVRIIMVRV